MTDKDVQAARTLLGQLGYELELEEVQRRFRAVIVSPGHTVMLAEQAGRVVGLCHAYERPAFDKPPEVMVQALVVDSGARQTGIGKALMAAAEAWAVDHGFTSVALSSHGRRAQAHAFYVAIGYQHTATSHLFQKELGNVEPSRGRDTKVF